MGLESARWIFLILSRNSGLCKLFHGFQVAGEATLIFLIEILKLKDADPPRVLLTFSHSAKSVHIVRETMKSVQNSPEWPADANGYRISWLEGAEIHRL
jgi:hypothetical protein